MRRTAKQTAKEVPSAFDALVEVGKWRWIVGPLRDAKTDDPRLAIKRKEVKAALDKIVKDYCLTGTEEQLWDAMLLSAERYWQWWGTHHLDVEGIAPGEKVDALESALRKVANLLKNRPLRNR